MKANTTKATLQDKIDMLKYLECLKNLLVLMPDEKRTINSIKAKILIELQK